MKQLLTTLVLATSFLVLPAQTRSIFIEFLGPSNTVGVHYDSRFNGENDLGYRVGLSYGHSKDAFGFGAETTDDVALPIEINYIKGKRSKVEVGIGANLGYYSERVDYISEQVRIKGRHSDFGYFIFSNLGYRYQTPQGFMLRAGITPTFNFGDKHGVNHKPFAFPYLSLGWSF